MSRRYDQYCPVATALDVVGDRWTLLILRDLLWYGPCRFSDFTVHNLGIPTALLTERLASLVEADLVVKDGREYRAVDPDGEVRSLIDGLGVLGERFLAASTPSVASLEYLARRMTSMHGTELEGLTPRSLTIGVGSLAVGCTIGAGRVVFGEPHAGDPQVRMDEQAFMQLVSGTTPPEQLTLDDEDADAIALLRFLTPAA